MRVRGGLFLCPGPGLRGQRDEVGVNRGSCGGVVFANPRGGTLADIELRTSASGHGPKRRDAEKECAEGATQRPPI
jgi:hypothetical protein